MAKRKRTKGQTMIYNTLHTTFCQLYHGENKLHFDEMMTMTKMMSGLH